MSFEDDGGQRSLLHCVICVEPTMPLVSGVFVRIEWFDQWETLRCQRCDLNAPFCRSNSFAYTGQFGSRPRWDFRLRNMYARSVTFLSIKSSLQNRLASLPFTDYYLKQLSMSSPSYKNLYLFTINGRKRSTRVCTISSMYSYFSNDRHSVHWSHKSNQLNWMAMASHHRPPELQLSLIWISVNIIIIC